MAKSKEQAERGDTKKVDEDSRASGRADHASKKTRGAKRQVARQAGTRRKKYDKDARLKRLAENLSRYKNVTGENMSNLRRTDLFDVHLGGLKVGRCSINFGAILSLIGGTHVGVWMEDEGFSDASHANEIVSRLKEKADDAASISHEVRATVFYIYEHLPAKIDAALWELCVEANEYRNQTFLRKWRLEIEPLAERVQAIREQETQSVAKRLKSVGTGGVRKPRGDAKVTTPTVYKAVQDLLKSYKPEDVTLKAVANALNATEKAVREWAKPFGGLNKFVELIHSEWEG